MSNPHQRALSDSDSKPQGILRDHERSFSTGVESSSSSSSNAVPPPRPVPVPRKVPMSPQLKDQTGGIEGSLAALNLSRDQQVFDDTSLISRVDELRKEEKLLQEHILLLRREKAQREQKDSGGFEQIRRKELDLAEREQKLHLMKSQMESEYSDNEFKLNQKRRELQHLEDQLHMKSKDLKQKEFDITNAESPADISGSQLAELADRQYELDRREQEINHWSANLQEKENEYKRRLDDLQRREASLYTHYSPEYERHRQYTQTQAQYTRQQVQPQIYTSPIAGYPKLSPDCTAPPFRYNEQDYGQETPRDYSQENRRDYSQGSPRDYSQENPRDYSQERPRDYDQDRPQDYDQEKPPYAGRTTYRNEPVVVFREHQAAVAQAIDEPNQPHVGTSDEELARQLLEEEEKSIKTAIYTDEMLALTLQQEEMDSGMLAPNNQLGTDGETASIIKKELDERLAEELRKKEQEEEDFRIAQQLSSGATTDDT